MCYEIAFQVQRKDNTFPKCYAGFTQHLAVQKKKKIHNYAPGQPLSSLPVHDPHEAFIVSDAVWFYSLIFALLPVMGWRKKERFESYDMCYFPFERVYSFLSSFVNFVLPLLIACGIYIKIYFIASQQQKTKTGIRSCGSVFTKNNCRHYGRGTFERRKPPACSSAPSFSVGCHFTL